MTTNRDIVPQNVTPLPWSFVTDPDKMGEGWMVASGGDWVIESIGRKSDEMGDSIADGRYLHMAAHAYPALIAALHALRHDPITAGSTAHYRDETKRRGVPNPIELADAALAGASPTVNPVQEAADALVEAGVDLTTGKAMGGTKE